MNKRIKVLVSAVLATVMLVLCIPFTAAAADPTSATFDFTSLTGKGTDLSGSSTLANTLNGCESTGSNYITAATATKVYSGNGNGGKFAQTEGLLKFGTSSVNGVLTFKLSKNVNKVEVVCYAWNDGSTDTIKVNSGTAVTAPNSGTWGTKTFEMAATNEITITTSKRVFIQSITVYFDNTGAAPACTHAYDDCEDANCNKCNEPRTAPGHAYTNEYDASCNNDDCTKSRTVTLPAAGSTLDYATATKIGAAQDHNTYTANEYVLTGVVKTIGHTTYGNITIEDSTGATFYLYTVKDTSGNNYGYFTDTKPVVGDTITVKGPLGRFNSSVQMNPAVVTSVVPSTIPCTHAYTNEYDETCNNCGESRTVTLPAADSTLTFDVANKLGKAQDTETANKYYVIGKVTAIGNATYGNMTIEDENGNTLEVYGTYSADGETRYDSMEIKPAVGDTVKLYGVMGQYNGTAQMENAWAIEITPAGSGSQGGGTTSSPDTNDSVVAYIAVAAIALFGIAYVSKKH